MRSGMRKVAATIKHQGVVRSSIWSRLTSSLFIYHRHVSFPARFDRATGLRPGLGEKGHLLGQMTGPVAPDPGVTAAADALSAGVSVGEAAAALGMLPRTLRRTFVASVGLTPKRFARVQRLQRVVRDLDGPSRVDWASLAAEHGYADQPHLAEEFRQLVGVTPTEDLRSRVNGPNHLRFAPPVSLRGPA